MPTPPFPELVLPLVDAALAEDVGSEDVTSVATVAASVRARGDIQVKAEGVLCGLPVARLVFARVDPGVRFEPDAQDGDRVRPGQVVARVEGPARSLLTAERTALNFLQHLSGIATATARMVALLEGTGTRLLDTRKTVPGLRWLAKYAVRCGGGTNHRMGLYDMILIKDNHVAAAGGITPAIRRAREHRPDLALEVEVKSVDELREALALGPDRVLLDNFDEPGLAAALAVLDAPAGPGLKRPLVELSGNVTATNVRALARPGVDFISSGAITHSAPALDLSLEFRA